MFDLDKWYEIYQSLSKHKLRTILTAFGVFWGIFMLVLLLGAGKGLENGTLDSFSSYASNYFYMGAGKTSIVHNGLNINRNIEPNIEDLDFIAANFKEIENVSPKQGPEGENLVSYKSRNTSTYNIQGIYPAWRKMEGVRIIQGRDLNILDLKDKKNNIVIGSKVRDFFFENDKDVIGKYLNIRGVYFMIVGVMEPKAEGWRARQDLETIWMPFSTMQITFNNGNRLFFWGCLVKSGYDVEVVMKKVRAYFARKYNFNKEDESAIWGYSLSKFAAQFMGLFAAISAFIWLVGFGTIIAGIVGVSNIMLITIKERTREIGLRKALGATPISIISLIVQEAIVLTTVSGYIGLMLGVGIIEGINYFLTKNNIQNDFFKNPEIDFNVAISSLILLIICGTFAGLIPAIRAAKISPIEALRDE